VNARRRGSALLIVVVVTFMVFALAAAYVSTSVTVSRGTSSSEARLQARTVAWSGLNRALLELDESCSAGAVCSHVAAGDATPCFGNVDGQVDVPGIFDLATNPKGVKNLGLASFQDALDLDHATSTPDGWIDFRDQTLARPGIAVSRRVGGGTYSVRVRPEGALVTDAGPPFFHAAFRIRAYGTAQGESAGLEALVVRETQRPFQFAAFGNATVVGNGSIVTDSWNSNASPRYELAPTHGTKGDLGSNGSVALSGGSGSVMGTLTPNAGRTVPDADVPPVPADAYSAGFVNRSRTFTDARVAMSRVNLTGSDVLTFAPPPGGLQEVWITDEASITGGGQIVIQQPPSPALPGTVRIYLSGDGPYKFAGNGIANQDPRSVPMNLQIVSAKPVSLAISGGANLTAVVYAPKASVDLSGTAQLMGGVVGSRVDLNSGTFHFDEALPQMTFRTKPIYRIATLIDVAAR
jgi:hypothetical protein